MNNQFSVLIKRYLIAVLIAILGLVMIIIGAQSGQSSLFNIAAVNVFVGGILALLFSAGILSRVIVFVVGSICVLVTIFIGVSTYQSVQASIAHIEEREKAVKLVQYNLKEIREMQRAHKKKHGLYAGTWEELFDFFKNEKVEKIDAMGSVPARAITVDEREALYDDNRAIDKLMTEREAAKLAAMGNPGEQPDLEGFKRDTVMVRYKEEFTGNISRMRERKSLELGEIKVEEFKYIPMTDPREEWVIETRDSVKYLDDTIPTIVVFGREPVPRFEDGVRDTVGFGNLSTSSDKGTWE